MTGSPTLRWLLLSTVALTPLPLVGCGDGAGGDDDTAETEGDDDDDDDAREPEAIDGIAKVEGWVTASDGTPLPGASLSAAGAMTTSDGDGHFVLEVTADEGDTIVVEVEAEGYVRSHERIEARDAARNAVRAVLVAQAPAIPMNSDMGGVVTGMRGARIDAPPAAFMKRDGTPVSGMVEVHLTPFNPADPAEYDAYPGDGLARTEDGELVQLETFGVLDVTVRQGDDELTIRDEMGVTVEIPLPDPPPADPPPTMPLWSFDEEAGVWAEEGTLTLDAQAGIYRGTITHLSPWNADQPLSATCVKGRVVDPDGAPVAGAWVLANGIDYLGGSTAVTDQNGEYCVPVRKSSTVEIIAYGLDGSVSREIVSGDQDTEVPPDCSDPRCLEIGELVLVPGVGDGNPWWGECDVDDADTWVKLELDSDTESISIDVGGDELTACGWIVDDPAAGPDEPQGTTILSFYDADGYDVVMASPFGSTEMPSPIESYLSVQRTGTGQEAGVGWCTLDVVENEEVADDAFMVGVEGTCEPLPFAGAGLVGNVDLRGIAGRFDGVIPTVCCDLLMPPIPPGTGMPGMP